MSLRSVSISVDGGALTLEDISKFLTEAKNAGCPNVEPEVRCSWTGKIKRISVSFEPVDLSK